ncbi:MAG: hypothetical protein JKX98_09295 [Alcanivoracaceae bacterium]|nr:hypothetical protein [Alcanivoracaceae bacterium]
MKDLNNQFEIKRMTMRDLTPNEQSLVAGGTGDPEDPNDPGNTTNLWTITTAPTQTGTITSNECGTTNAQYL